MMLGARLRAAVTDGIRDRIAAALDDFLSDEISGRGDDRTVRVRVVDPAPPREGAGAARVFLRPVANPLSLGFLGVFVGTMALTALQLSWIPVTESHTLAQAILVCTVPVELVACVFGFLGRDLVAATGMGVQAGIWGMIGLNLILSRPGSTSSGLAFILVMGAAALCIPAAAGVRGKALAGGVLVTTAARWGATAAYEFSASSVAETVAGAVGIVLALAALYASLAFELEDQQRRTVLPTFRTGRGAAAMERDLAGQVAQVANEAGVRSQL